jgi:D-aminoacyl-tRNA deacylase
LQDNDYVLIVSTQDLAGVTIVNYLKSRMGFTNGDGKSLISPYYENIRLHIHDGSLLHLENLDKEYPDTKSFIFLSKHRSDSGISSLTCHCTGNFADNPYGGNPKEVAIAYPSLQKEYLKAITAIAKQRVLEYDVTIEATHHGPTSLKKPVLFVELGSSMLQWTDSKAATVMCDSLLTVLCSNIRHCKEVGIALGGTHYPTKFNKLLLNSEFGLAAVASKHNLQAVDEVMLDQMITKSIEPVTHIVIDSKGLGSQKERIMRIAESTRLKILKL